MRTSRMLFSRGTIACLLLTAPLFSHTRAQTISDSSDVIAESLLEQIETESDNSAQLDRLQWLEEHPFDLNTVSREELATIPRVTAAEISSVLNLRKRLKRFSSVNQLELIEGTGDIVLEKLRPYVVVAVEEEASKSIGVSFTSRTQRDLQPRAGFRDASFVGSSLKHYHRIIVTQPEQAEACLVLEKDAGERIADSHLAGYVALSNLAFLSHIIVGDFVVEAGQGLALWRGSAFGKGSEAVTVLKKTGLGAQPYRSVDEFNFLRGVAASSAIHVGEHSLVATLFSSRRSLSASSDEHGVSSFYEEGLFRTESELRRRGSVVETMVGGRLQFLSSNDWRIGSTFYRTTFSKPIVANSLFEFAGRSATLIAVDGELNVGWLSPQLLQLTLFGELARSGDHAIAGMIGSLFHFTRRVSVALGYREYSPRFASLHAAGFGERGETNNERGFYLGAEAQATHWLRITGYLDHFTFPWRTFFNPLPSAGRDLLVQADVSPFPKLEISTRYSDKKSENIEARLDAFGRDTRLPVDRLQQKLRLTATYTANKRLRLRGRIEHIFVDYDFLKRGERGMLLYYEMRYGVLPNLTAEARIIVFDTDSYDSRVYEFENDVRGVFSNPALYGKGRRWYLLARWKPTETIVLSAKYSETLFDGVKAIGSGLSEIQGEVDNRVALQLDVKF